MLSLVKEEEDQDYYMGYSYLLQDARVGSYLLLYMTSFFLSYTLVLKCICLESVFTGGRGKFERNIHVLLKKNNVML